MSVKFKTPKTWSPDEIKALLAKSDKAVGRALLALLDRQTAEEVNAASTLVHNKVGFSAFDAEIMTSMAQFFRRAGFLTAKQLAFLRACPGKQKTPRIAKYAGQLADIANAKVVKAAGDWEHEQELRAAYGDAEYERLSK